MLRSKARLRGLNLADAVIDFVAERVSGSARDLVGAILKLQSVAAITESSSGPNTAQPAVIDINLARRALGEEVVPEGPQRITIDAIMNAACRYFGVKPSDLQGKRRNRSIAFPRQVCMYLARLHTGYSFEEIGGHLGGRDHTTILHGFRQIKKKSESDPQVGQQVRAVEKLLGVGG
jgi:chromosomal replication initiator protein